MYVVNKTLKISAFSISFDPAFPRIPPQVHGMSPTVHARLATSRAQHSFFVPAIVIQRKQTQPLAVDQKHYLEEQQVCLLCTPATLRKDLS